MVTLIEWGILGLLTTLTGLLSAYIIYRVIRKGLKATINGFIPVVTKSIGKKMEDLSKDALKDIDLQGIAGGLAGGEGGLGQIGELLGGGEGGLGDLIKLFSALSGKK